jgi:hypothetical protein
MPQARSVITPEQIERARQMRIVEVVAQRGLRLRRAGNELIGPCPRCGGRNRFAIQLVQQVWNCRGCKKDSGCKGDVIGLVMFVDACGFREAVERLTGAATGRAPANPSSVGRASKPPSTAHFNQRQRAERQRDKAEWMWQQRRPIEGTPAERYLRLRGYTKPIPPTFGYFPPRWPGDHPAMIAAYGFPNEVAPGVLGPPQVVVAVHLTLLKGDGSGKADVEKPKFTVASPLGRPIVISAANDLLGGAITEGNEDGFAVYQSTGLGVWAAGSASYMPALASTVALYFEAVTIYAHDDNGKRDALKLADLCAPNLDVFIEGIGS